MNTTQLSNSLARFLSVDDPADPPAGAALDILRAINAGLQKFYAMAPPHWRRTTLSLTLRAPTEMEITFTSQYSNALTGDPFVESQVGCTLRVEGQPDNEIIGTDSVLDDYLGTTLTVQSRIFDDAAAISICLERLVTDPRIRGGTVGPCARSLMRCSAEAVRDMTQHRAPAAPTHYAFEGSAPSGGGGTIAYLRVGPAPDADYTVRFDADIAAADISFANLTTPTELPVPEPAAQAALVPLCAAEMITSGYWRDPRAANAALASAESAASWLLSRPRDPGLTHHRIGTPDNF